ncbi:MAG: CBS domain-containing protein [Reyranella sp.]|uniref:CBS domain-containing protein n=1 Tax=Reyranella sp. TaxID=1929291 RepID=UPI003D0DCD42
MRARDVMSKGALTVAADRTIFEAVERLIAARVSALLVVDKDGKLEGIVSEADLIGRVGTGESLTTPLRRAAENIAEAAAFVRSRSQHVADVMTRKVVTADVDATLGELAELMVQHHIKRLPIVEHGAVVGIVSRIDLLQGLLSQPRSVDANASIAPPDETLGQRVEDALRQHGWAAAWEIDVVVQHAIAHLWGVVPDEQLRRAFQVAAEQVPGITAVDNHIHVVPRAVTGGLFR